jgi:chromosome segregation ATPase
MSIASQDLCLVPFRCVDEINQGMDPDNERAIFNMMVTLLAAGDNPTKTQYFLYYCIFSSLNINI